MTTVDRLLDSKGREVWSVAPDTSVFEAIKTMAEHGVGALLVMEADHLVGIISERDYARKVILMGRSSHETPVSEIMTSQLETVTADQTVEQCMAIMTEKRIRHLPVVAEGRVVGMISVGDLVKHLLSEKDHVIGQLEGYIAGTR